MLKDKWLLVVGLIFLMTCVIFDVKMVQLICEHKVIYIILASCIFIPCLLFTYGYWSALIGDSLSKSEESFIEEDSQEAMISYSQYKKAYGDGYKHGCKDTYKHLTNNKYSLN